MLVFVLGKEVLIKQVNIYYIIVKDQQAALEEVLKRKLKLKEKYFSGPSPPTAHLLHLPTSQILRKLRANDH